MKRTNQFNSVNREPIGCIIFETIVLVVSISPPDLGNVSLLTSPDTSLLLASPA